MESATLPPSAWFQDLVLKAVRELGGSAERQAIYEKAVALGDFTEAQMAIPPPPGNQAHLPDKVTFNISFALSNLKRDGRLINPARGLWAVSDAEWALIPGENVKRSDLHDAYGGRRQGGIGPSATSPNVLIFSEPERGEEHGYIDTWRADGCFHYTGEGQRGDQRMASGNAAILNHKDEGRRLRLFTGAAGDVTYEGEFEVDVDQPYYTTDAPETDHGPIRQVVVFRLRPLDRKPASTSSRLDVVAAQIGTEAVPIEEQWTEKAFVAPAREPYEAERREQKLVHRLRDHLEGLGHEVVRLKIVPPGEAKPLFTDLYDTTLKLLVEAKGTTERGAIRTAIGQLADYRRYVTDGPRYVAALLPERPREDLVQLLSGEGIDIIWLGTDGLASTSDEII